MSKKGVRKTQKKLQPADDPQPTVSQEIGQVEDDLLNILDELQGDGDDPDNQIEPDDICCEIDGGASDDIEFIEQPKP